MPEDSQKIIYSMLGVSKRFEKKVILENINLSYFHGAKIGVLGLNGSGKSTLLKILAGVDKNYDGQCVLQPGFEIGYLEQEPQLDPEKTARQIVEEGAAETFSLLKQFEEINNRFAEPLDDEQMNKLLEKQGHVQEKLDALDAWTIDQQLEQAMDALRCPPDDQKCGTMSGGEKRRVALCRLLLKKPDILILDEPTNHLDAESVLWLEQHLQRYPGTVIAVTHDRYFLDNVAGWILELDRARGIPWKGNYSSWLEQKQARLAIEQKQDDTRRKALARELEWVRSSPRARQAKSKARLARYEQMVAEDQRAKEQQIEIYIPPGPRLGTKVFELKNVTKAYGEKLLMDNVSFVIPPNAIVGVIGPNGAGKTTLFRMLTGLEKPDSGEIVVGQSVQFAYVEQMRDDLSDPNMTIYEAISDGLDEIKLGQLRVNARAYVARLGFTGTDQQKPVGKLSGGERNRVHLGRMLKSGCNVLMLDEPTNDLDINSIRALEEALENFAGCAIVISHDRWFLDRVATHILAFEGDSQVVFHEGNFQSYEEDRHKRMGTDADTPHRIKYRRMT
ncbi:MAG TPA: energy-dependent translational throttle protein EttA [Tepidisphaeraceae bacterium]|nr:energy-dependent translational throttle protein EttA [Tepidisphaeraceae bacterium]